MFVNPHSLFNGENFGKKTKPTNIYFLYEEHQNALNAFSAKTTFSLCCLLLLGGCETRLRKQSKIRSRFGGAYVTL